MKNLIKKLVVIAVVISLIGSSITVFADANSKVKFSYKKGTLTVSGTGAITEFDATVCKKSDVKKLVIKSGITEIKEGVFENLDEVTSINSAKTVNKIAQFAFYGCDKLKSLTLSGGFKVVFPKMNPDDDWDEIERIGRIFFGNIKEIHFNSPIKKLNATIYNAIHSKKIYTSKKDKKYKSYKGVLYNKKGNKLVMVPSATKTLKVRKGCKTITARALTYSYSVQGEYIAYCNDIEKVSLPKTVTKIVDNTVNPDYGYCTNAKWTSKAKKIGGSSFEILAKMVRKKDLKKIFKASKNIKSTKGMWITKSKTLVRYYGKAKKIKVPAKVKRIGDDAFKENKKIKEIKMSKALKTIGDDAFIRCSKLKKIKWNKKIKSIGERAFELTHIKTFNVPKSCTKYGEGCFSCNYLTKIIFPKTMKKIPTRMFESSRVKNLVIPGHIKTIGKYAFADSKGDTLTLKEGVQTIKSCAFDESGKWNKVILPKSLKIIEERAFCEARIGTVVFKGNNTIIESSVFTDVDQIEFNCAPSEYRAFAGLCSTSEDGECTVRVTKIKGASGLEIEVSKSNDYSNPVKKECDNKTADITFNRGSNDYNYYRIRTFTNVDGKKVYGKWCGFSW